MICNSRNIIPAKTVLNFIVFPLFPLSFFFFISLVAQLPSSITLTFVVPTFFPSEAVTVKLYMDFTVLLNALPVVVSIPLADMLNFLSVASSPAINTEKGFVHVELECNLTRIKTFNEYITIELQWLDWLVGWLVG